MIKLLISLILITIASTSIAEGVRVFGAYTGHSSERADFYRDSYSSGVGYSKELGDWGLSTQVSSGVFNEYKPAFDYAYLQYQGESLTYKAGLLNTRMGLFYSGSHNPFSTKAIIPPALAFMANESGFGSPVGGVGVEYDAPLGGHLLEVDAYYGTYVKQNSSTENFINGFWSNRPDLTDMKLTEQSYLRLAFHKESWRYEYTIFNQNYEETDIDHGKYNGVFHSLAISYNTINSEVILEVSAVDAEKVNTPYNYEAPDTVAGGLSLYWRYWMTDKVSLYAGAGGLYSNIKDTHWNNHPFQLRKDARYSEGYFIGSSYLLSDNWKIRVEAHRTRGVRSNHNYFKNISPEDIEVDDDWWNTVSVSVSFSFR